MAGIRRMRELVYTGRTLTGPESVEWGLANRSVPPAELEAAVDDLVGSLARHSPQVQRYAKLAYSRALEADKDTLAVLEQFLLLTVLGSDDAREGLSAFLDKRPPAWGGGDTQSQG
jgi:enoyl-CoA hydratase/carnithine racemase